MVPIKLKIAPVTLGKAPDIISWSFDHNPNYILPRHNIWEYFTQETSILAPFNKQKNTRGRTENAKFNKTILIFGAIRLATSPFSKTRYESIESKCTTCSDE